MLFSGLSKVFSTIGERQYDEIGAFWDAMSACYGMETLQGLGYRWTEDTITYVIGFKNGALPSEAAYSGAVYQQIQLPDAGWLQFAGRTEELPQLYDRIYADGALEYEIEEFFENGDCRILVIRK